MRWAKCGSTAFMSACYKRTQDVVFKLLTNYSKIDLNVPDDLDELDILHLWLFVKRNTKMLFSCLSTAQKFL